VAFGKEGERPAARLEVVHTIENARSHQAAGAAEQRFTLFSDLAKDASTLDLKAKYPGWDSNPHCRLFESRLSNQLEYRGSFETEDSLPFRYSNSTGPG
jgi:hypothetical protein